MKNEADIYMDRKEYVKAAESYRKLIEWYPEQEAFKKKLAEAEANIPAAEKKHSQVPASEWPGVARLNQGWGRGQFAVRGKHCRVQLRGVASPVMFLI